MATKKSKKDEGGTMKAAACEPAARLIREIAVGKIHDSPYQTRKDRGDLEGLAASLRQHGLMNPVTVRALGNGYELIAGHRRVAAARLALLPSVLATVVECGDRTAAEMCVAENMQRQDLSPLEEAAGVDALIATNHTPQDVADRLGRTRQWVARRRRLLSLTEAAKDAYADMESAFSRLPVEALEMIAALPDAAQDEIVAMYEDKRIAPTAAAVRAYIDAHVMRDLKRACFDTSACEKCQARTGCQPDLFDGGETCELGRCLNPECFRAKREAKIKAAAAEIRHDNPGVKIISEDYGVRELTGAEWIWAHTKCKKSDPGAVQAWEIKGDGSAKSCWIEGETARGTQDEPKAKTPTQEEKRMAAVCLAVSAKLKAAGIEDHPFRGMKSHLILRVLAVTGTETKHAYADAVGWSKHDSFSAADFEDALWDEVKPLLVSRVAFNAIIRCEPAYMEAVEIGKRLFGMDKAEVDALPEAGT